MDEGLRLVIALSVAGLGLLALELWLANGVMAIVGGLTLAASVFIGFRECDFEVGALTLLVHTTIVNIGFLCLLTFAPQSPVARAFFLRAAHRRRLEDAEDE